MKKEEIEEYVVDMLIKLLDQLAELEDTDPKRIQSAAICISRAIEFITGNFGITELAIDEHQKLNAPAKQNLVKDEEVIDKDKLN